jgi:hypothetical protein
MMSGEATRALDEAQASMQGTLTRTRASVIGVWGGENIIFATMTWGWTVTAVLHHMRIGFTVTPRGWLQKKLVVEGTPPDLVGQILDGEWYDRVLQMRPAPVYMELAPNGLRLEHRYGADIGASLELTANLARRAKIVQHQSMLRSFAE